MDGNEDKDVNGHNDITMVRRRKMRWNLDDGDHDNDNDDAPITRYYHFDQPLARWVTGMTAERGDVRSVQPTRIRTALVSTSLARTVRPIRSLPAPPPPPVMAAPVSPNSDTLEI